MQTEDSLYKYKKFSPFWGFGSCINFVAAKCDSIRLPLLVRDLSMSHQILNISLAGVKDANRLNSQTLKQGKGIFSNIIIIIVHELYSTISLYNSLQYQGRQYSYNTSQDKRVKGAR